MGGWAQAITQGLGRAGSEYAQAKDLKLDEQQKKLQLLRSQLGLQEVQQALGLNQSEEGRRAAEEKRRQAGTVAYTYRAADGKIHNIVRDPTSGVLSDQVAPGPGEESPIAARKRELEAMLGRPLTPEEAQQLGGLTPREDLGKRWAEAQEIAKKTYPNDPKKQLEMARSLMPGGGAATNILFPKPAKEGSGASDKMLKSLAAKWVKDGVVPPAKYKAEVEEYMEDHDLRPKTRETTQILNADQAIRDVLPLLDELSTRLEGMKDKNGFMDMLAQRGRWLEYRLGKKITDPNDQAIANLSAFVQIAGAQPWTRTGRGRYIYDQIIAHLPDPSKDTPANMYDKAQRVRGLLSQQLETDTGTGGEATPPNPYQ